MFIILKRISIIIIITIFLLEIFGVILSSLRIIPNGSPAVMSIFAHKKWSLWHPKNISFKHHYNTCWGPTKITFNNIGARGLRDVQIKKSKPRIALLGDSMIEMIHVKDGDDIGSLLQKKLPNYEVINFSSRGTGISDHLDIYKNLIKNYNIDYLIYYPSDNDLVNNFILSNEPDKIFNQPAFYFDEETNQVIKINRNEKKMKKYFSNLNKIKRTKFVLYLKEYSYTFKIYYHIKTIIRNNKVQKIVFDEKKYADKKKQLPKQKKVYKHIMNKFIDEIEKDKINLITILNYKEYVFTEKNDLSLKWKIRFDRFNFQKDLWQNYNNAYYNLNEAKDYIKLNNNNIIKPFVNLGHVCDDHYSKYGSEFITNISLKRINAYFEKEQNN